MRSDFQIMQEEMNKLSENMGKITRFSAEISESLKESGTNVSRLCSTRQLLDKLQFLFLLPTQLSNAIKDGRYTDAVRDYARAQRVLQRYGNQPSFQSIQTECEEIISDLKKTLRDRLFSSVTTASELAESVGLLQQLQESDSSLEEMFLTCAESRLEQHLQTLTSLIDKCDILEWVEKCNSMLLNDLGIIVSCYHEMFANQNNELPEFAESIMSQLFHLFESVLKTPDNVGTEIYIRGLDKFFRKLQAMTDIISSESMSNRSVEIVVQCIFHKALIQSKSVQLQFKENLTRIRQSLASKGTESIDLKEILNSLQVYLIEKVQASLLDLMAFLQNSLSFGLKSWCAKTVSDACWKIISETMINLSELVKKLVGPQTSNNIPFELLLILAKLCLEMQDSGVTTLHSHLLKLLDESAPGFKADNKDTNEIMVHLATAAQAALDTEVVYIGQTAAQMLRVSVLARDWLRAPEPRGPRAVCRRVVETLTSADAAAAQLFPSGVKQSSDSSRRTLWPRIPSSFSPISRIFSERIEVFSPAGADRAALSTGALKVALKALVECVRLRTFGRHGLQQLQVDVHFLQQRLSCIGNDERLLNALLEDALASAQLRCVDPQLMEPSKLKEGVTFDRVLYSIQNSESDNNTRPRSYCWIVRIHNIVQDFNNNCATKFHHNDAINNKLWVQEMNKLDTDSPVLYYKEQKARSDKLDADDLVVHFAH
ncbi:Vacuolar protein sorting-associated protein 51 homolog [Eumeta japonica]|uniref:Vacuolar protein sorting-associated protein 51 homolog n=1 Tax=Eumeta variegata TaxID=151549 RepID=A0A4C1Z9I9_EUMVA|nr:Vacuolar protein sorting-associated protein 51 homolog [Eumeta japonica]